MTSEVKFTLVNDKIRVSYCGGPAVLSPKEGSSDDCCCGCNESEFEEMTLMYSACHGCEAAVFGVFVSFDNATDIAKWTRIGRVNLNTSLASDGNCTYAPEVYIGQALIKRIIKKREDDTNCCTLYVRLKCELGDSDGGWGVGKCHSGAAALKITRDSDGFLIYDGICGESSIAVDICPASDNTDPGTGSSG